MPEWVRDLPEEAFVPGTVSLEKSVKTEEEPQQYFQDISISLVISSIKCWIFLFNSSVFKISSPKFLKHFVIQLILGPSGFQAEFLYFFYSWKAQPLFSSNLFPLKNHNNSLFKFEQDV